MIASWVLAENLGPFLTVLAWVVGYKYDPEEWMAISFGIEETNDEAGRWYTYEFAGKHLAQFEMACDPETDIVHVRLTVPESLETQIALAMSIFSHFRVAANPNSRLAT